MQPPDHSTRWQTPSCRAPSGRAAGGHARSAARRAEPVVGRAVACPAAGAQHPRPGPDPGRHVRPWETGSTRASPPTARRPPHAGQPGAVPASTRPPSPTPQFATFVKATGYVTEAEEIGLIRGLPPRRREASARGRRRQRPPGRPLVGSVREGRRLVAPGRAALGRGRPRRPPGRARDLAQTPRPTAAGPASGCRPRRSGSTPRRGGLEGARFAWGDELTSRGPLAVQHLAGRLPAATNTARGRLTSTTAPVRIVRRRTGTASTTCAGNVWEWCQDALRPHDVRRSRGRRGRGTGGRPAGSGQRRSRTCARAARWPG